MQSEKVAYSRHERESIDQFGESIALFFPESRIESLDGVVTGQ